MTRPAQGAREPAVAFIGTLVPDTREFRGPAFSVAGQKFVRNLVAGLCDAGLSLDLFSVEPTPAFPRSRRLWGRTGWLSSPGLPRIRFVPFLNLKIVKAITSGCSLVCLLLAWGWRNRNRRRVICLVNLSIPPAAFVLLAARLTGASTMVIMMDVWRPGHIVADVVWWKLDFWLNRRLVRHFDGHLVVSRAIADDLVAGRDVFLLDSAVDPAAFASREGAFPRAPGMRRLVLAGGLSPHNGVNVVLEAFETLDSSYELYVAGGGALGPAVQEAAARNPRVHYAGLLDTETLIDLYRSADLLLNMRLTRAVDTRYFFPSKLMEMLASGSPVLSTATGHTETSYGRFVYILRDESPAGLAARIDEILHLEPHERAARSRAASEFALAEKSWTVQTSRLADYIRRHVALLPPEPSS